MDHENEADFSVEAEADRLAGAIGAGMHGNDNRAVYAGDIDVFAESGFGAAAGGIVIAGTGSWGSNKGNVDVFAEGDAVAAAFGMGIVGKDNYGVNEGAINAESVSEDGLAAAIGIGVAGFRNNAAHAGGLIVSAEGDRAVSVGMGAIGIRNQITADGDLWVFATGREQALALGMGVAGFKNKAVNEAQVDVYAEGEQAAAIGMAALGGRNRLVNTGIGEEDGVGLHVWAKGDTAAALGLGVAGGKSRAINEGGLYVDAEAEELAAAIGMAAVGKGNLVLNTGAVEGEDGPISFGGVHAAASGYQAVAVGIGVGDFGNVAINAGDVRVSANSPGDENGTTDEDDDEEGGAIAAGMIGIGEGNWLINAGGTDDEDEDEDDDIRLGSIHVEANGEKALSFGMGVAGVKNRADNAGELIVEANAEQAGAIGMAAIGTQNELVNTSVFVNEDEEMAAGGIQVEATGYQAAGIGMGAAGSQNLLLNTGDMRISVESLGDGTGTADEDGEEQGWAIAAGMAGIGQQNLLINTGVLDDDEDELFRGMSVQASGDYAIALGMAAIGTVTDDDDGSDGGILAEGGDPGEDIPAPISPDKNWAFNAGDLEVYADGGDLGVAVGMAAVGERNVLINAAETNGVLEPIDPDKGADAASQQLEMTRTGGLIASSRGDIAVSIGMAVGKSGNLAVNLEDVLVTAGALGNDDGDPATDAVAIGLAGVGQGNTVVNIGVAVGDDDEFRIGGVEVQAVGWNALAAGMGIGGEDNTAVNLGDVTVVATRPLNEPDDEEGEEGEAGRLPLPHQIVAVGMVAYGDNNRLLNVGDDAAIDVWAAGDNAEAAGMMAIGDDNRVRNASFIDVEVSVTHQHSDLFDAAGIVVSGDGNTLKNADGGQIQVTAYGEYANAAGLVAVGSENRVTNEDAVKVEVGGEGEPIEAGDWLDAMGMIAFGEQNRLINRDGGFVHAVAEGDSVNAAGIVGIGRSNKLINAMGGIVHVAVDGENLGDDLLDAIGMGTLYDENVLVNGGVVQVTAKGDSADGKGMAAFGSENVVVNRGWVLVTVGAVSDVDETEWDPADLEFDPDELDWDELPFADAESDLDDDWMDAVGLAAYGDGNVLRNAGDDARIFVMAAGKDADAIGMAVHGSGNVLVQEGEDAAFTRAVAQGENAEATGVWAHGEDNEVWNEAKVRAQARGIGAEASGIVVTGQSSLIVNSGDVFAEAMDDEGSEMIRAKGIIADGSDHTAVNVGSIRVSASGEDAYATGISTTGAGNTIRNAGSYVHPAEAEPEDQQEIAGYGVITVMADGPYAWAFGIEIDGSDHEIVNDADAAIDVLASGDDSLAIGITSWNRAKNEIKNAGTIHVAAVGSGAAAIGIDTYGDGVNVVNEGTISFDAGRSDTNGGDSEDDAQAARAVGIEVLELGVSTLKNSGTVAAGLPEEARPDDFESDVARSIGIIGETLGGNLTIENTGTVSGGPATDLAAGILVTAWDDGSGRDDRNIVQLSNSGTITVEDSDAERIAAVFIGPVQVVNGDGVGFGEIHIVNKAGGVIEGGNTQGALAIGVVDAQYRHRLIRIENEGTINGDIEVDAQHVEIALLDGSFIKGAVVLGSGDDSAVLWGGANLAGLTLIDGGEGENRLELNAKTKDQGDDLQGKVKNFQEISIEGGTWTLDHGELATKDTRVKEDSVLVLTSELRLQEGGSIGGRGTIVGSIINEGGTLTPGDSPGILEIDGNYEHHSDATYVVEIDHDSMHPQPHDQLNVVDRTDPNTGNVTIHGGTVLVDLQGNLTDHYGSNTYAIVTASGTIQGEFGVLEGVTPSAFIDYALAYDSNKVTLTVTGLDFSGVAQSANEKSVARILDSILKSGDPDGPGFKEVEALYTARTNQEARNWMNQLSGEVYTVYPVAASAGITRFVDAVTSGMHQPGAEDGRQGWVTAYGATGKLKADAGLADAKLKYVGGAAGMHLYSGPAGKAGLTAGFAHNTVRMDERHSKLTGDGYQIGAYGQFDVGSLRMTGVLAHGRTRYDGERKLLFGHDANRVNRTASSSFDSTELAASFRGVLVRPNTGGTVVEPSLGLTWLRVSRNGINEDGAGDLDQRLDSYSSSWLRGDLGVGLTFPQKAMRGGWAMDSSVQVAWVHDFSKPSRDVTGRLKARPDETLRTKGTAHKADGFQVGLDLHWHRPEEAGLQWMLKYDGEFRSDVQTHSLQAGLSFNF